MSYTSMCFVFLIGGTIIANGTVAAMAADIVANAADAAGHEGAVIVTDQRGKANVLPLLGGASRRTHSA